MVEMHWIFEWYRLDAVERDRQHELRARWNLPRPARRPGQYRRRLAGLLLLAANWLDPRRTEPSRPGWVAGRAQHSGTVALAGYRRR
jgi:hypothetical protein